MFCLLLETAGKGGLRNLPADIFLRLDPLVGIAVPVAARAFIVTLIPALAVIFVATLAGRIFCGWICPMGTTLDAIGGLARVKRKKPTHDPVPRSIKYILLAAVLAAALLGANIAFWASPIPLVTRLYTLVLHPASLLSLDGALALTAPALQQMGLYDLQYWFPTLRSYHTVWFVAVFWFGLILLECVRPRFWCRYICPAGALLGLVSGFSSWRRRTSKSCNACGQCAVSCPAGILYPDSSRIDASRTDNSECLTCRVCETACKRNAVYFGIDRGDEQAATYYKSYDFQPSRRAFIGAVAVGAGLAGVTRLDGAYQSVAETTQGPLVRPPGSVPETDFLARCVRCAECMKACPTGGLQPAMLQAGVSGMFSPFLDPRSGPCNPECAACGAVCPSGAIQALPLHEKRWAKIGTATIDRKLCLAWEEDKRCMVCQETCPYGAVKVVPQERHIAPVPVVSPERCYGCGFCERHCPTVKASIRVKPMGALRQHRQTFEDVAKSEGLELDPSKHDVEQIEYDPHGDKSPPGFLD